MRLLLLLLLALAGCGAPPDVAPTSAPPLRRHEVAYFTGDSLTKAEGMRLAFSEFAMARGLDAETVGAFTGGDFPDNQHSAVSGVKIRSVRERAKLELGAGNPYPDVSLVFLMIGTNNVNDVGVAVPAAVAEYAETLDVIAGLAPNSRIFVTTLPPIKPGVQGAEQVDEYDAELPAAWDSFDARHEKPLVRWDMNRAIGPFDQELFVDSGHPNPGGWAKACADPAGLVPAIERLFSEP